MGYSISWLALQLPADAALTMLGLRPTGEQLELPEAPLVGAMLSSGWYLVLADRCDHVLIAERTLEPLSAKVDVVACSIEEHVMVSVASQWSDASQVWSVMHDAQQGIDHLEIAGELPAFALELREQGLSQQLAEDGAEAEVDHVFDIPLNIARQIVGWKHDEAGEPARFDVLAEGPGSVFKRRSKSLWKLW